ncbi:hypothetical protein [Clostridium sp. 'White wine YQ']|uniref:hypothetical protein n=1 Tax=Clostridium sp. 'White wine YQ' TaxID=3027474 RepID=UPI0023661C3C|nr:hypothetical protein [Clostridium sp. 'White wine YQ']MDD7795828.1 hypothetical protein [Clostridium sp. 'White wine YQ']
MNLDELLLAEAKLALKEVKKNYTFFSTINLLEQITGTPFSPSYSASNVGFSGFLSIYQKELGIKYWDTQLSVIDEKDIYNPIWTIDN